MHLLMLDMSRAFDTIDRGTLLHELSSIIEPDELHLVSLLLTDVQLQVNLNNVKGNIFKPDIGSPQGDCASPIWFIFYLNQALQAVKSNIQQPRNPTLDLCHDHPYHKAVEKDRTKIPKGQSEFCIDQQYADDASWATTKVTVKEEIKTIAPQKLRENNLLVNEDKTEEFEVSRTSNPDWKKCKLLGSLLGNTEDIKRRKQLASAAFANNKRVLCSKEISLRIRIRIFVALISSIFLYNSELWVLSSKETKKIDSFQRSFLRQIIRTRFISNVRLYKTCGVEPWSKSIKRQRLNWFGHLVRLPDSAPAKKALSEARKPYKKLRGGQPLTWLRTIAKDFNSNIKDLHKFIKIAYNRRQYAEVVDSVMSQVTYPSSTESESED